MMEKLAFLNPVHWISSVFFIGRIPYIGPAVASLVALIAAAVILHFWGLPWLILATVGLFFLGVILATTYINTAGSEDEVVLDEVVGIWLVIIAAKSLGYELDGVVYFTTFLSFVIFDYTKPWPADLIDENVHGGLGVMLDDAVTAIYGFIGMSCMTFFYTKILT